MTAYENIWYPGVYVSRQTPDYLQLVSEALVQDTIERVRRRAQEDGEWAIKHDLIGEDPNRMRRLMAWVSDENNITQCLGHLVREKMTEHRTIDWVCRDLAKASKMSVR